MRQRGAYAPAGAPSFDTGAVSAARVAGRPPQLARIVQNLLDNASTHARRRIAIVLRTEGDVAVLHVDDDGPGVPAGDRAAIFERFTRLDAGRARRAGGAGLGLAITARVVDAHGGTIAVSDAPLLGGARFTVRLPLAAG